MKSIMKGNSVITDSEVKTECNTVKMQCNSFPLANILHCCSKLEKAKVVSHQFSI